MKKKILSLVLALLMTASSASAILADDVAIDEEVEAISAIEEEVEVAGQYDNAIKFLNQYGIFKGKSADDLGAEDMLERYQMALFVSRIATGWVDDEQWEDGPENWSEFTDISEGPVANYWGALSYANSQGIIEGYGNGKFGPTDGITYQNALTMVVRTLGYQGLEWPWGYIQKAVELGLTEGITGITYQDELNRGEVAQIIYNALFATTKSGSTLAMKSFGIEFGWEKVVITASDLDIFTKDNGKANAGVVSKANGPAYKIWNDSDKTDAGYVAFKLLNDDGSLGEDTYYMLASDIGLSTAAEAHDDEAVVGDAYYMLFEKDADSDLVKVVAYESLLVDTIKNEGKTDDEGEAQEYAIQEFLKDYKFVSKYTGKDYLNVTASGKNELLVYTATSTYTEYAEDGNYLAIDWLTGDILTPVYEDEDGNGKFDSRVDTIEKDEDGNIIYQVEWYYNELLEKYYQYEVKEYWDEDDEEYVYYLNYMTDKEFEDTYAEFLKYAKSTHNGYKVLEANPSKSAYAELKVYDTNLDGVADRGIYETYRLGKFSQDTAWCGHKNMTRYNISNVSAYGESEVAVKNQEGKDASIALTTVSNFAEGDSCGYYCQANRAWFVEGYTPVEKFDEDGEFTGYAEGYVIYTYDSETGAIKVVKNIGDDTDADTYVATGVLRAYNLSKGTVTIGDEQFSIKDYDELIGNAFRYVTKNYVTRSAYSDLFRDLFNQFVEYVVVDGELVNVRAKTRSDNKLIVVDSYAGLSSDGYIVVNGYSTADLKYTQFRIGSYDGWTKGDCYYYLTEEKAAESFTKGTMYAIRSYDAENDVYYVNLAGEWDDGEYVVTEGVQNNKVTIVAESDGYMAYNSKYHKMSSSDKYVIIPVKDSAKPYASLYVYEGKLPEGAKIEGRRINGNGENDGTYVIVNATVTNFDELYDTYKSGLVLLLNDSYIVADYNGTDSEDWYLLGASKYTVEAFDVFAGKFDIQYVATNVDLEKGHIYFTQDGVIVEDLGLLAINALPAYVADLYPNNGTKDSDDASYAYGSFTVANTEIGKFFDTKDDAHKIYAAGKGLNDRLELNKYRGQIDELLIFAVAYEDDVVDYKSFKQITSAKDLNKIMEKYDAYNLYANWVYSLSTKDMVVYIDVTEGEGTVSSKTELAYTNPVKVWEETLSTEVDAYISVQFGYTTETVITNGVEVTTATIETVLVSFGGYDVEHATHDLVAHYDWHFGAEGACDWESIVALLTVDGEACYPVRESIVADTYDCEDCNLVKSVEIPVTFMEDGAIVNGYEVEDVYAADVEIRLADVDDDDAGITGDEVYTAISFILDTNNDPSAYAAYSVLAD